MTINAKWRERYDLILCSSEEVTWYKDGNEFVPEENNYIYRYYEDEDAINADNITVARQDYIFMYWYYLVEQTEVEYNFNHKLEKDMVIYPKWQIEQYTVYFSKGVVNEEDINKFENFPESKVVDKYTILREPVFTETVEDWDFDYWRESGKSQYDRFDFEDTPIIKDTYLVIQWTYVNYKIDWIIESPLDGSDIDMTQECVSKWDYFSTTFIGDTLDLPTDCIAKEDYPQGYTFAGWALSGDVEANEVIATIYPDPETHNYRNFRFYAIWARLYNVTFTSGALAQDSEAYWWWCNPNDTCDTPWEGEADEYQVLKVAKYSTVHYVYDFYYYGHYLSHWYLEGDYEKEPFDFESTQITNNITLHPYFELKDVTMTFVMEDEKAEANADIWPSNQTIKFGERFECPEGVLVYPEYEFMYWAIKSTSGGEPVYTRWDWFDSWNYEYELRLYPVWETVKYSWNYVLVTPDGEENVTLTGNYISEVDVEMNNEDSLLSDAA